MSSNIERKEGALFALNAIKIAKFLTALLQ